MSNFDVSNHDINSDNSGLHVYDQDLDTSFTVYDQDSDSSFLEDRTVSTSFVGRRQSRIYTEAALMDRPIPGCIETSRTVAPTDLIEHAEPEEPTLDQEESGVEPEHSQKHILLSEERTALKGSLAIGVGGMAIYLFGDGLKNVGYNATHPLETLSLGREVVRYLTGR